MTRLLIPVFAMLGLAAAGCGKDDDHVGKLKGFTKQMCDCAKDKDPAACRDKVDEAQDKFEEELQKKLKEEPKGWGEEKDKFRACRDAIQ